jgi:hypothetical protein
MLTIVLGIGAQSSKLVAQHVQLDLDVGAMFLRKQVGELCLDLGLLVEQSLDGGAQRRIERKPSVGAVAVIRA